MVEYKPNNRTMEIGEKRNFRFFHNVGVNSISGTPVVTCSGGLTLGTVSVSGTTVSVPVTASRTGSHWVKCAPSLSSAEDLGGVIKVKVIDSTRCEGGRDYD